MKNLEKRLAQLGVGREARKSLQLTLDHSRLSMELKWRILDHLEGEACLTAEEIDQVRAARI